VTRATGPTRQQVNPLYKASAEMIRRKEGHTMDVFAPFLESMENPAHRARMEEVLGHIMERFPELAPRIAWNQPMFTHHDTFIIGFSAAKAHMAVAPENVAIDRFSDAIKKARDRILLSLEENMLDPMRKNTAGPIFLAKNYGYSDHDKQTTGPISVKVEFSSMEAAKKKPN
jgi:uncharacterized protein YdhG (YjbR/CyaY superfamily)